ncbi:rod shape-determining protein RodA [Magnetococcales bacterium HHB-1]
MLYNQPADRPDFYARLKSFPWDLLGLLVLIALLGLGILYSAVGGEKNIQFLFHQGGRFVFAILMMMIIALGKGERFYRRYAYVFFAITLVLLLLVPFLGSIGMGARRWLQIGSFRLQPSELIKVTLVLALARYFHDLARSKPLGWRELWGPLLLMGLPLFLIIKQPDLGTAILAALVGGTVVFVAGLPGRVIVFLAAFGAALSPVLWSFLHGYQKQRILTLFNPESDPLGAGYHIIQSKIAVGSGGLLGKGFMGGSQSHLNFLPERHTDFIFSVLAEEWGFVGCIIVLFLYGIVTLRGLLIASAAKNRFGILAATGFTMLLLFHVIINIGMVLGTLPVVGLPLPLISYGGSSMFTTMIAMGILAHIHIHSKHHGQPATLEEPQKKRDDPPPEET